MVSSQKVPMMRTPGVLFCFLLFVISTTPLVAGEPVSTDAPTYSSDFFMPNLGQLTDMEGQQVPHVLYYTHAPGMDIFITTKGLTFLPYIRHTDSGNRHAATYTWQRVDVHVQGGLINHVNAREYAFDAAEINIFHGNTSVQGLSGMHRIVFEDVYPGIDWELMIDEQNGLKYNFIVAPHADIAQIQLQYSSALPVFITERGGIDIQIPGGFIHEAPPVSFIGSTRAHSTTHIQMIAKSETEYLFTYSIPDHNSDSLLIIDPALYWSTYYGGNKEECFNSVITDSQGNLILTGWTDSPNFPVATAGTYYQGTKGANEDAMIVKFSPDEERLWATFYGGNAEDWAYSVCTDESDNIFISGETVSPNFPVYNAGTYFQGALHGDEDVFILKFDASGNRLWATFYGGDKKEGGFGITADPSGNIFVTGYTESNDFPKLNAGTYYQASMAGVQDAFILKFSNTGNRLWATYLGGNLYDACNAIDADDMGNIFIIGDTRSTTFPLQDAGTYYQPVMAGDTDMIIGKFSNTGTMLWSSYFGGTGADYGHSILTDAYNEIHVAGWTNSTDIPVLDMGNYFQALNNGGYDGLKMKFTNSGDAVGISYLGGTGVEKIDKWDVLAEDACGNIYIALTVSSPDMPLFDAGCSSYYDGTFGGIKDIYIARFTPENLLTWATYFGHDNEDLNACIGTSRSDGKSLYLTGQYNEYDPGAAVPLADPGGTAWYDGSHNGDDEAFIAKFEAVPLVVDLTYSNICYCADSATAIPSCGVAPYTYLWTDGQTTQTAVNLCAGAWDVIVEDADCNIDTSTFIIDCILPLELISFSGEHTQHGNLLTWTITDAPVSARFELFRSDDAASANLIAEQSVLAGTVQYAFLDDPNGGKGTYILKGISETNQEVFSETIMLDQTSEQTGLTITYPETEKAALHYYAATDAHLTVSMYALNGSLWWQDTWVLNRGENTYYFDHPDLPKGCFLIVVRSTGTADQVKFYHQ